MRNRVLTLALAAFITLWAGGAWALTADEIMDRVDKRDDGDNGIALQHWTLIDKNGHERHRRTRSFTKDKGRDIYRLMFFTEPADVRGTGFLTYDYREPGRDDDQWLYLPELKKAKRIATSDKSSAFMGTDFSYADMTKRIPEEWNFRTLKEGKVRGKKVWLIEALPKNEEVRDRYGYTKSVLFVRRDNFMVVRAVHWTKEGNKLKYMDSPKVEKIDGIWTATMVTMKTTKAKRTLHKTVMEFKSMRYNQNLDMGMFTVRNLKKGL